MKIHRKTLTQFRAMMIEMTFAFQLTMEGGNLDGARGSGNMVQTDAMYQVTFDSASEASYYCLIQILEAFS